MVIPPNLTIDTSRRLATLVVSGDCDIAMRSRVEPLLRAASDAGVEELEIDLCATDFADCSAIHLVDDAREAVGHVTVRASAHVDRLIELTHTERRFGISACR